MYRLTEYQTTTMQPEIQPQPQPQIQPQIQPQPQPQLNEDAAAERLNRDQLMELFDQQDAAARDWNADPDIQDELRERTDIINNTNNYHTGNRIHHLRSIQMVNSDNWDLLFGGPYAPYLHNDAAEYGTRMIHDANYPPASEVVETLYVSLLFEANVRPGVHQVIFIIHADPHRAMHYGHIVRYEVEDAGEQHQAIEEIFNANSPRVIIEECTEYDILSFLADEYEMRYLLQGVFLRGLNSRRFVENDPDHPIYPHACSGMLRGLLELGNPRRRDDEMLPAAPAPVVADAAEEAEDAYEIIAIPPPPPRPIINNDIAQIYQFYYNNERDEGDNYREAVRARRAENNQVWNDLRDDNYHHHRAAAHDDVIDNRDGNIIGYWLENDYRINQYLDIQEERQRNSAEAAAEALAAANAPFVVGGGYYGVRDVRGDINEEQRVQG